MSPRLFMNLVVVALTLGTTLPLSAQLKTQSKYTFTQSNVILPRSSKGGQVCLEVTAATVDGLPVQNKTRFLLCTRTGNWRSGTVTAAELIIEAGKSVGIARVFYSIEDAYNNIGCWVEKDGNLKLDIDDFQVSMLVHGNMMWGRNKDPQCYLFLSNDVASTTGSRATNPNLRTVQNFGTISNLRSPFSFKTKSPTVDLLCSLLPESKSAINAGNSSNASNITLAWMVDSLACNVPSSLPENWKEISSVQNIFIPLDDLTQLQQNSPEKIEALKRWIAVGGRLIVSDCGKNAVKSQQVYRALELPTTPLPEWRQLTDKAWNRISSGFMRDRRNGFGIDVDFLDTSRNGQLFRPQSFERVLPGKDRDQQFRPIVSHLAQGQIVALEDDMSQWSREDWKLLLATLESAGADIHSNIGGNVIDQMTVNDQAIPGVKEPKQSTFQILILIFVIVAGPLNYFFLSRIKRLNALLLTVPLISLCGCLCLFGYAFFVQGFGVKIRQNNVTYLDQRNQLAVQRSLNSIFSGLHPGKYDFTDEQLVFVPNDSERKMRVRLNTESVQYSGGMLQPRTPHEISVLECFPCNEGLAFDLDGSNIKVRSQFKEDIDFLLFRIQSQLYFVEDLPAGGTGSGQAIDKESARMKFTDCIENNSEFKFRRSAVDSDSSNTLYYASGRFDRSGYNNYILDSARIDPIAAPQTYMAVFKDPWRANPLRINPQKQSGTHVVIGKW